ncbi:glycosyltransferase family 4 protein [Rhodonellum sp.]|uniref:glycosyltransferase family 4 protein n=1 Tax=Rhodonellum sp. TaxID=2231180 RepID=UPI0027285A2D|nr:glycosyltransferase family 4 protein [Rhodonellum sp.]MDO9551612.1 glycosyltransferase family 4 protein [Rhodonellum sp.]
MQQRGKVIFLHSSSELYGASKILLYVLEIFRKSGFDVLVILPGEGPLKTEIEQLGFSVQITNLGILRRKHFHPMGILNRFKRLFISYRFLKKIQKQGEISLIYSNTLAVLVGAIFARRKGIPHIWHIHEIIKSPKIMIKFLARSIDASTLYPVVVSDAVAKHWEGYLKKAKPQVIYNGLDYGPFLEPEIDAKYYLQVPINKTVITMVGRINPGKGQLFFLEMAKELVQKHKNVHFLLVGDPYPGYEGIHDAIKSFIEENGLAASVQDLGFRLDIPEILKATDIFVLPSILPDSFPTVVLEAMATGLPIVATKSGGAEEMIDEGETGFLIEIGDRSAGVEMLDRLITNPELARQMGRKGQIKVQEEYSFEKFNQNIQQLICQISPKKRN